VSGDSILKLRGRQPARATRSLSGQRSPTAAAPQRHLLRSFR